MHSIVRITAFLCTCIQKYVRYLAGLSSDGCEKRETHKEYHQYHIAHSPIWSYGQRLRQSGIQNPTLSQSQICRNASIAVDNTRYACVGRSDQRQAFFDRANARDGEMLARPGAVAIPRVVRHIEQP